MGHEVGDRSIVLGAESKIAVGQDALEPTLGTDHRETRDVEMSHHIERFLNRLLGPHRHRVDDHPGLRSLDPIDLLGLSARPACSCG